MAINKKVKMDLVGLDGNAFVILGSFGKNARRQGWTEKEIMEVREEAKSGDYDNLLRVIMGYCEDEDEEDEDEEDEW